MKHRKLFHFLLSPLIVSSIFFLFFQLQIFNIHLFFRDEGFLNLNALRIINGDIPYRDFFMTTTPGTYYLQALVIQMFGHYLILDRILFVLFSLGIIFLITKIFKTNSFFDYLLPLSIAVLVIGPSYAFYNIEGLFLILLLLLEFNIWLRKQNYLLLILLGITISFLFIFKQSYGIYLCLIFILLIFLNSRKKYLLNNILSYFLGIISIAVFYIIYLLFTNSLNQFIYYVFFFSKEVKSHRDPFIITSLIFIPLYLLAIHFLKKMTIKKKIITFIIFAAGFFVLYLAISPSRMERLLTVFRDLLVYYYLLFLVIPLTAISFYWKMKSKFREKIITTSFVSLGVFLASASSGRDYTTVTVVAPFFLPLCFYLLHDLTIKLPKTLFFVIFVFIFLSPYFINIINVWINLNKYNSYVASAKETSGIKISKDEASELDSLVSYTKSGTGKNVKIICFPYCPMINVLAERNSASYFSFFYPETFLASDQKKVINDLSKNKSAIVILQRKGSIEPEANFEDQRLRILKQYFLTNYHLSKRTNNFDLYVPQKE